MPREISWLLSRPADGGVITAMQQIADEYAADHPGFSLNLITTPDRPSYIQKYETLAAANKLPELFDTDATPFAQKLADQGRMVDVEQLLDDLGLYDDYRRGRAELPALRRRIALHDAVRVPAGVLLVQHGASSSRPASRCPRRSTTSRRCATALREAGRHARSRSTGRTSGRSSGTWPTTRSGLAGPEYVQELKNGDATFADPEGEAAAEWLHSLGQAGCFAGGLLVDGLRRRAGAVHLGQGGRLQHRHVGARQPRHRDARPGRARRRSTTSRCRLIGGRGDRRRTSTSRRRASAWR